MTRYEVNSGKHIDDIIGRTSCERHGATRGEACWYIRYNTGNGAMSPAVCGLRIVAAGFNGKINPNSLRQKSSSSSGRR